MLYSLAKPQMCTHQEGQQGSFSLDYFVVIGNENAKEMAGIHFRREEKKEERAENIRKYGRKTGN